MSEDDIDQADDESDDEPSEAERIAAVAQQGRWIGPWRRRMWLDPLGTDPVMQHILRSPVPGERLCEAVLYRGRAVDDRGWIVRLHNGNLIFANGNGAVRSVDASAVAAAMTFMESRTPYDAASDRIYPVDAFRADLDVLRYSVSGFCRDWGVADRTVRRWLRGDLDIPHWVYRALKMMIAKGVEPEEVF